VPGEVVGRFGRPAGFQIRRTSAHHGDGFPDPRHDQAAVGETPDTKGDIDVPLQKIERDVLFKEIDGPILQAELNIDLRKRRQELRQNRL